jgi:hypothetical protein
VETNPGRNITISQVFEKNPHIYQSQGKKIVGSITKSLNSQNLVN